MDYDNVFEELYHDYTICSICHMKVLIFDIDYHLLTHSTTNYWYCPVCLHIIYYYEHSAHMRSHRKNKCCIII